jgi:hypothetical protein
MSTIQNGKIVAQTSGERQGGKAQAGIQRSEASGPFGSQTAIRIITAEVAAGAQRAYPYPIGFEFFLCAPAATSAVDTDSQFTGFHFPTEN